MIVEAEYHIISLVAVNWELSAALKYENNIGQFHGALGSTFNTLSHPNSIMIGCEYSQTINPILLFFIIDCVKYNFTTTIIK